MKERKFTYSDLNLLMITVQADILTLGKMLKYLKEKESYHIATVQRINQLNEIRDSLVELLILGKQDKSTVYEINVFTITDVELKECPQ